MIYSLETLNQLDNLPTGTTVYRKEHAWTVKLYNTYSSYIAVSVQNESLEKALSIFFKELEKING